MFFLYCSAKGLGEIFGSSLLRKMSRNSSISKQNFCFERRFVSAFFANPPGQKGTTRANYNHPRSILLKNSCALGWLLLTPSAGLAMLYEDFHPFRNRENNNPPKKQSAYSMQITIGTICCLNLQKGSLKIFSCTLSHPISFFP